MNKPPLGVMPRYLWESVRLHDLSCAINRYLAANRAIPVAWIEEYNELTSRKK